MNILLVAHQFLPDYSAGTEVLTLETAKALQARGHRVAVFAGHPVRGALPDPGRIESYSFEGISVTRFSHGRVPMGGCTNVMALEYDNAFLAERFRRHLEAQRPDVVHFFHLQRLSGAAVEVCEGLGIPCVFTVTDYWAACPTAQLLLPDGRHCPGPSPTAANCLAHLVRLTQPAPVARLAALLPQWVWDLPMRAAGFLPLAQLRALAARQACIRRRLAKIGRILAPTAFMKEFIERLGVPPGLVVRQAFGIAAAPAIARPPRRADAALRVGFIGTLLDHKGAHVLVQALRSLPVDVPLELKIYGDAGQFPGYAAKLRQLAGGDPRIAFCGTFPRREIGEVMRGLDVLAVPSLWHENMPLVILHAQAAGCPVAGSRVAGIAEAVRHEEDGLLFEAGDAAALAGILRRLAVDRALLDRLTAAAPNPKSAGEYADELAEIYRELVSL